MKNVRLCVIMIFTAAICGLAVLPAAAVSTSNRPDSSGPAAPLHSSAMPANGGCVVPCPSGAVMEQESCGEDKNGGCNMPSPVFEPIACGETICATAWAYNSIRDTDWYEITLNRPMTLTFKVRAEFPVRIAFVENYGVANCSVSNFSVYSDGAPCADVNVVQYCLPGTYWLWVGDQGFDGNPCGSGSNNYVATLTCQSDYCEASAQVCDEYISNVLVGSINNSSGCSGGGYSYTNLSTEMVINDAYPIMVTNGLLYTGDQCGIWVDWNQDSDFDDPGEAILVSGTPGVGPYTATIIPPLNAKIGNTTMRVRITYTGEVSPCGQTIYGEVEDYTIAVQPYCEARGGCDEYISNVLVGSINNSSGCSGYADYTALSTKMVIDNTYPITVANGTPFSSDQCGIWVDWNQDSDFNDPGEAIQVSGTPGPGPYTATIVPSLCANAKLGNTIMRVRITYTGEVSPCGQTVYGEVEDYTVKVEPNADLNRDGIVDLNDFVFFADQWLKSSS